MATDTEASAATVEPLASFDLRMRHIDREPGDPINLCSTCHQPAHWSVWLHTPEWGTGDAGLTLVLCTRDAIEAIEREATRGTR